MITGCQHADRNLSQDDCECRIKQLERAVPRSQLPEPYAAESARVGPFIAHNHDLGNLCAGPGVVDWVLHALEG
jgi:hypothetical protein